MVNLMCLCIVGVLMLLILLESNTIVSWGFKSFIFIVGISMILFSGIGLATIATFPEYKELPISSYQLDHDYNLVVSTWKQKIVLKENDYQLNITKNDIATIQFVELNKLQEFYFENPKAYIYLPDMEK